MPEGSEDLVYVENTDDFGPAGQGMTTVVRAFDGETGVAVQNADVVASGEMEEGNAFCAQESGARAVLRQYLADTSRGLRGFHRAIVGIGGEYEDLIVRNDATLRPLLRSADVPAAPIPVPGGTN